MAEEIISSLVSEIAGNFTSWVLEEFGFVSGLKTEFEKLRSTLSTIKAVIHDAEEKQLGDEAVKDWLRKLKDAAYDARDIAEEFTIEAQRRRQQRDVKNRVRSFFSLDQNPLVFRVRMAGELKNVMARLDKIAEEKSKFHLRERTDGPTVNVDRRKTGYLIDEPYVYGREKERDELICSLLSQSDAISVHAIWGMGGLGKTTLTQSVYNHPRVKEHFDQRIWVCVSVADFELSKLMGAIIENIEGRACDVHELATQQLRLQQKLGGRRFLLVLDDIWDYDVDKWSKLNSVLKYGAKGSAVITTTRIRTVAQKMATADVYDLGTLSEEDSWSLFQSRAFRDQRKEDYAHLEAIGKEIVKKCGGVPLAIKAMGSLMQLKRKENEWLSIRESNIWDLRDEGSMILPVLKLTYDHLPSHIKQCFAFCSVFPKDFRMEKDTLIQLWMANGYFSGRGQMDLHDVGNEVFDELLWHSLFQEIEEVEKWHESGIITCKMHDLVHDLAESIITDKHRFFFHFEKSEVTDNVRPLAVYMNKTYDHDSHFFSKQKRLRAVGISAAELQIFSIFKLKHLRYLEVSGGWSIKTLPDSVCSLQYLQTLKLDDCFSLEKLPKRLKQLQSLVYLYIINCKSLRSMPAGVGGITGLRKLSVFVVGKEDAGSANLTELGQLKLGGQLSIQDLQNVKDSEDARRANLNSKKDLHSLELSWKFTNKENDEEVLQGLQPPQNLKKLRIDYYGGTKSPSWIMDLLLPKVVDISLKGWANCKYLPPFGKLQFLKKLELYLMNAVESIDDDSCGIDEVAYPSLESINIRCMESLRKWLVPSGRNNFPLLQEFSVFDCPRLVDLPVPTRVKQLITGIKLAKFVIDFPSSLTAITFNGSRDLLPEGVMENHKFVKEFEISDFANKSLSNQLKNLSELKHLRIIEGFNLESLADGLENLNRLESLYILWCDKLQSLPVLGSSGMSSLRTLSISRCAKLASLTKGLQHLTALEKLAINDCTILNSLAESVRHLSSLRRLSICDCKALSSLPNDIGYLTSLSVLIIDSCPKLRSLPDGMQNLTSLKKLEILKCPYLEKRCKKKDGEDWGNIAHIPIIRINERFLNGRPDDWFL